MKIIKRRIMIKRKIKGLDIVPKQVDYNLGVNNVQMKIIIVLFERMMMMVRIVLKMKLIVMILTITMLLLMMMVR